MNFHILTLFPDMVENGLKTSITGRAIESGAISVEAVDIRDYTTDKHRHVDDAPYGGGAGMVIQPGIVLFLDEFLGGKVGGHDFDAVLVHNDAPSGIHLR